MNARIVLEDCRKALSLAEGAREEQEFRVHWVALVTLLRAVGHVLVNVDGASSPALRASIDSRWNEWKRNRSRNWIFWDFIEPERNSVLKTYETAVQPGDAGVVVAQGGSSEIHALDECLFKPLIYGPFAGQDARDVAQIAISWWDTELSEIERSAACANLQRASAWQAKQPYTPRSGPKDRDDE